MSNRSIRLANEGDSCPTEGMRPLLHVVTWFYDYQPGMMIYAQRLKALSEHYRIELIARAPLASNLILPKGVSVVVMAASDVDPFGIPAYCWKVAKMLRSRNGSSIFLLSSHLSMMTLMMPDKRVGIYWNEMPDHYFHRARFNKLKDVLFHILRKMTYLGARRAEVVMPISEFMAQDLVDRGCEAAAVHTVPMGVASDCCFDQHETSDIGPIHLCYAGSLAEERGRSHMINGVIGALKDGVDVKLTIAGVPALECANIKSYFVRAGFPNAIRVYGLLSHKEVLDIYRSAHAGFALAKPEPYYEFNPPGKLFEYMVMGLPVVCNAVRSISHYVKDGETAFICDYSATGVAGAIKRIARNRSALKSMSVACRDAGRPYLWNYVEPQFKEVMQRLFSSTHGGTATVSQ